MDEQIKSAVLDTLDRYDKDYQTSSVADNLLEWETQKGRLVDLLRNHPNWCEDALAVTFEVTEDRAIEAWEVKQRIDELIAAVYTADGTEQLRTALYTAVGGYSKFITDDSTIADLKEKCKVKCAVGQKTSRVLNSICQMFGVNAHPEYNAYFAKLADSLNPLQVKKRALLSVHPCDYLEMSGKSNSWNSCHKLDGGEYHGGTLSYMNDSCSMIFYTVDDKETEPYYSAPKRTRQVFCYENGILLQSRLYPNTDDNATSDTYRNIVQRTLADCLNVPNLWTLKREHDEINKRVKSHEDALHYRDYEYKCYHANISLLKDTDVSGTASIVVGAPALCLECSRIVTECNTMYCDDCDTDNGYVHCDDCGVRVHRDDAHWIGDGVYCDECCSWCEHCQSHTLDELTRVFDRHGYELYVCETCRSDFECCVDCEEYVHPENGKNFDDGFHCKQCVEKNYHVCEHCDELVRNDTAEPDRECHCANCAKTQQPEPEQTYEYESNNQPLEQIA